MTSQGRCHCGRIAFEVEGTVDSAPSCNGSTCQRKGSLLWFVPHDRLRLKTPEDAYGEAIDPNGRPRAAIDLRCLADIDLDAVPVTRYDGRAR
jgi:hypothetical protein